MNSQAFCIVRRQETMRSLPGRPSGLHPYLPPEGQTILAFCRVSSLRSHCLLAVPFIPLAGLQHGQGESLHPQSRCVTCRRSPEVSSTAFDAQPPDLPPVDLMDMGFAITCSLARHRRPHIRFLFIGSHLCSALLSGPASRRVLFHPLRFAVTSPPSGCQRDFHPQAVGHARHTRKKAAFWTRPVGTSSRHEVSHNYFG